MNAKRGSTNAQRQKQFRNEMKKQGYKRVYCWLSPEDKQTLIDFAKERDLTIEIAIIEAVIEARAYREQVMAMFERAKHM